MFKDGGLRGVLVERELLSERDGLKFRVMGVALTCCLRWFPLAQQCLARENNGYIKLLPSVCARIECNRKFLARFESILNL